MGVRPDDRPGAARSPAAGEALSDRRRGRRGRSLSRALSGGPMGDFAVVHYLNQFFGGIGGEEAADLPIQVRDGPVGPGRLLQQNLGAAGRVVATIFGGDNYVAENRDEARAAVRDVLAR